VRAVPYRWFGGTNGSGPPASTAGTNHSPKYTTKEPRIVRFLFVVLMTSPSLVSWQERPADRCVRCASLCALVRDCVKRLGNVTNKVSNRGRAGVFFSLRSTPERLRASASSEGREKDCLSLFQSLSWDWIWCRCMRGGLPGKRMPQISQFYGIIIKMYYNDHLPSHFHAEHGDSEAVYRIETLDILRGSLPQRAHAMVLEWASAHRVELRANWVKARYGLPLGRIAPLT
jgi:hypothetical protein